MSEYFCYILENIFLCKVFNVNDCRLSDYLLIVFKFRILGNIRGKGFWKLNVFVLYDVNYVKIMNDFLNNLLDEIENEINLYIKWDLIKI